MRTIQLYATGSSTASAVAQVTIPVATTIRGAQVSLMVDAEADADYVVLEFSKVPSSQINVNGAQDPFVTLRAYNNLVTSGMTLASFAQFFPLAVACRQGEIIYLHAQASNASYFITAIFHYA